MKTRVKINVKADPKTVSGITYYNLIEKLTCLFTSLSCNTLPRYPLLYVVKE